MSASQNHSHDIKYPFCALHCELATCACSNLSKNQQGVENLTHLSKLLAALSPQNPQNLSCRINESCQAFCLFEWSSPSYDQAWAVLLSTTAKWNSVLYMFAKCTVIAPSSVKPFDHTILASNRQKCGSYLGGILYTSSMLPRTLQANWGTKSVWG